MHKINGKIHVNIDGKDGNVFSLISLADSLHRQLGGDKQSFSDIYNQMMSSDYLTAIYTLIDNFGDFIVLEGFVDTRVKVSENVTSTENHQWF